jgi:hypothetical protein
VQEKLHEYMMISARIGITPNQFYDMTPLEFSAYVDAQNVKQDEVRQQIILQSYMTAALTRTEKMPSLQSLLDAKTAGPEKQELTDTELLEEIRKMNAAIGGVEVGAD